MAKTNKHKITWEELRKRIDEFKNTLPEGTVFGIPRGGAIIAEMLNNHHHRIVYDPKEATIIIDDIYDSGCTIEKYREEYPNRLYFVLIDKRSGIHKNKWYEFPYEKTAEIDIEEHVRRIIEYLGEDPNREGLINTPGRVVESWNKLFGGYHQHPENLLTTFDRETYSQMILLKDIEFFSTCEHHFLPFFGRAHIAYIPKMKLVGVSKLARLLEIYARRLQIQERIGEQITRFLMKNAGAIGAGCILEAQHFCMTSRGVEKQNSLMLTSSLKGVFQQTKVREEFLNLIRR